MVSPPEVLTPKRRGSQPLVIPADDRRREARRRVRPLNITVLMGGPGSEREVSLASGEAVATALESLGHRVWRADVGPENLDALEE